MNKKAELNSEITCPKCGHKEVKTMPTDSCQWFYQCNGCKEILNPINDDCCILYLTAKGSPNRIFATKLFNKLSSLYRLMTSLIDASKKDKRDFFDPR